MELIIGIIFSVLLVLFCYSSCKVASSKEYYREDEKENKK